jgi:hypothetical protein
MLYSITFDTENDRIILTLDGEGGPTVEYNRAAATVRRGARAAQAAVVEEVIYADFASTFIHTAMGWAAPNVARRAALMPRETDPVREGGLLADAPTSGGR